MGASDSFAYYLTSFLVHFHCQTACYVKPISNAINEAQSEMKQGKKGEEEKLQRVRKSIMRGARKNHSRKIKKNRKEREVSVEIELRSVRKKRGR